MWPAVVAFKALAWLGVTVGLFFTGALGIAGGVAWHRILYETATTVGTLTTTRIGGGRAAKDGTAIFTVAGATYDGGADRHARVGDRVPVRYDPTDPAHNSDPGTE